MTSYSKQKPVFTWQSTGNNWLESVWKSGPCMLIFSDFIQVFASNINTLWEGRISYCIQGKKCFLKNGLNFLFEVWKLWAGSCRILRLGCSPLEGAVTSQIHQQPRLETALEAPRKNFLHIFSLLPFWKLWIILHRYYLWSKWIFEAVDVNRKLSVICMCLRNRL